jgi:hypothetical protein
MKKYIVVITLNLTLLLAAPANADDYVNIVEQALANINSDYHQEWAFTESVVEDGETIVGRYDPSQSGGARWNLISIDGQQPTKKEISDFAEDREDKFGEHDNDNDDDENGLDLVNLDTLELIEETNDFWVFRFVPRLEDDEDDAAVKFMQKVDGTLRINRHGNFLEYIDLRNDKPIRPAFSVKISRFLTHLAFGPANGDGPIVPLSIDVEVKGRAMLVVGIDETESTRYYSYNYVGS